MRAVSRAGHLAGRVGFGEVEEPAPLASEAVLAVRAFAVNRGELSLLEGRPDGWRPGQDVAGDVVMAAADGSGPSVGERVVGRVDQGGWAERVAVPTDRLAVLPDSVTYPQAATLPIAGLTALRALRMGDPLLGTRVLVTGAGGGVGRFAVELAVAAGAQVTAVGYATDELCALGAVDVEPDVEGAGSGFALVVDTIGGPGLTTAVGLCRPGATVVLVGAATEEPATLRLFDFAGHGVSITSFFSALTGEPDDRDLATLVGMIADGRLHPHIGHQADWFELPWVLDLLLHRTLNGGKAVLTVH
jgi:NADPH:quinone reductase